ncbi:MULTISPECIES: DUF736 family protein [unclassified Bradyrhizobium]|uniref:DUF736 family protein n=1 Tax=unclassified Bradyrhizobium TaxID=2631580 RepID=UPI003D212FB3
MQKGGRLSPRRQKTTHTKRHSGSWAADEITGSIEVSNKSRDYLSVKLDDPSFNAPIHANGDRRQTRAVTRP